MRGSGATGPADCTAGSESHRRGLTERRGPILSSNSSTAADALRFPRDSLELAALVVTATRAAVRRMPTILWVESRHISLSLRPASLLTCACSDTSWRASLPAADAVAPVRVVAPAEANADVCSLLDSGRRDLVAGPAVAGPAVGFGTASDASSASASTVRTAGAGALSAQCAGATGETEFARLALALGEGSGLSNAYGSAAAVGGWAPLPRDVERRVAALALGRSALALALGLSSLARCWALDWGAGWALGLDADLPVGLVPGLVLDLAPTLACSSTCLISVERLSCQCPPAAILARRDGDERSANGAIAGAGGSRLGNDRCCAPADRGSEREPGRRSDR